MQVSNVLRAARAKIEQGWTQGAYARDCLHDPIGAWHDRAACWCSLGAVIAAAPDDLDLRGKALDALQLPVGYTDVVEFNDTKGRTKQEVLDMFDLSIKETENAGS